MVSRKSKRAASSQVVLSPATKKARQDVVCQYATKVMALQQEGSGNRAQVYGKARKIIDDARKVYPWLSRDNVYYKMRTMKNINVGAAAKKVLAPSFITATPSTCGGGRPSGTSNANKAEKEKSMRLATDELVKLYSKEKDCHVGKLPRGVFAAIRKQVLVKHGFEGEEDDSSLLSYDLVRMRLSRGASPGSQVGTSPVAEIEPTLLVFATQRQEAGQPLTPSEALELANSLIDGKPVQERLKQFQATHGKEPSGILSKGYWRGFKKRHKNAIESAKGYRQASKRQEWTTYPNLALMYDLVYDAMVTSGVAKRLSPDEYYWVDGEGNRVSSRDEAKGHKVKIELTHPEWVLFGDEVGTDTAQDSDGQIGGQVYLACKGTKAQLSSSTKNSRFTMIGLTAATGHPVMCIIIMSGEEMSTLQRLGYDLLADNPLDQDKTFTENSGPGKAFPGGPSCSFRGHNVPAFITQTKSGSVDSDILRLALQRLDDMGVYPRTPNGPTPFVLLDAHDSRLQVPFLKYVNEKVENRPRWRVSIGLPNGTHEWQVGDSKQQNGSYKMAMTREKDHLMLHKKRMHLPCAIEPTDIIPLVNRAWAASFARTTKNQNAIRDRGWNPLNYRLLTNPIILRTKSAIVSDDTAINSDAPPVATVDLTEQQENNSDMSSVTCDLTQLNFDHPFSRMCSADLLQFLKRKESVNEELAKRYEKGKEERGKLDFAKKLGGGYLFKRNHVLLDDEVLKMREEKENKKETDKKNTIKRAIQGFRDREKKYEEAIKLAPEQMKGKHYKAIVTHLKRKDDPKIPTKVNDLKARYEELTEEKREKPTLLEYLQGEKGLTREEFEECLIESDTAPAEVLPPDAVVRDDDSGVDGNQVADV